MARRRCRERTSFSQDRVGPGAWRVQPEASKGCGENLGTQPPPEFEGVGGPCCPLSFAQNSSACCYPVELCVCK